MNMYPLQVKSINFMKKNLKKNSASMLIFINYYTKFTLLTFMFFLYLQGLREHRALSVNDKNYTPANVAK